MSGVSKKYGARGGGHSRKRSPAEAIEASQRKREYAERVEAQFDRWMQARHSPNWRTVLTADQIASEYEEFRRRRNKYLRQHRHFDGPPPVRPARDFSYGPKPAGLEELPPLGPPSREDSPTE
jgi:hypothetical protein